MNVPFLDLGSQYLSIKDEIDQTISDVLKSTAFAGGPFVEKFEKQFASYCNTDYAIGCSSGTDALLLALRAAGIGKGDEVITVPNTFIATFEAICLCGAQPVFIDVNEKDYTIDPLAIEAALSKKTKAIIPVHLYGQMADMDPIMDIAGEHNLLVIEDACQAHGAEYKGKKAGSIGDLGCFSFYPGKNLGAYGEAGAVVTCNNEFNSKIKMYRDHGQSKKYFHDYVGWNGRMDGFQGAILSIKLKYLDKWNDARITNADHYSNYLKDIPSIKTPYRQLFNKHVYHIYAIAIEQRDRTLQELKEIGISCGIHYPVPIHLQKAYTDCNKIPANFPVSEKCSSELLSLPMYAELTKDQIEYISEKVIKISSRK